MSTLHCEMNYAVNKFVQVEQNKKGERARKILNIA